MEEIECLRSIYCKDGEFIIHSGDACEKDQLISPMFSVNIISGSKNSIELQATVVLSPKYPDILPEFTLTCDSIKREEMSEMRKDMSAFAEALLGQPMLFDLMSWLQENAVKYSVRTSVASIATGPDWPVTSVTPEEDPWTFLLLLDHMRAKKKYVKTIQKWTKDLELNGRLIFEGKLILILLQGKLENIKEYVVRQRTVSVDVDSKGRSCKERMMNVLCEEKIPLAALDKRFQNFEIIECTSKEAVKDAFHSAGLESIFDKYITSLYSR
ncbi:RWD domain-containing protein 3-like [Lineus longissimus]|uniref:RWD domain-containing protein 3-like n=1 Tax=Lineus longissimus TaxID=88925 RepID=UPI002B4CDBE1